jgi:hypothetical protein
MTQRSSTASADDVAVTSRRHAVAGDVLSSRAGKPSWGGLVMRALPIVLLAGGCSLGAVDVGVTPVTIRPLPPIEIGAEAVPVAIDADARRELTNALEATRIAYEFETTITVDDTVTMFATGAVSGVMQQSRVVTTGSVVEYMRTDDGRWIMGPGDRLLAADRGLVGEAPLDGLTLSDAVAVDQRGDDGTVLHAVYEGGAVGAPGVEEVEVQVTIRDGRVRRVHFHVPVGESTAEVITLISVADLGRDADRDVHAAE